MNKARRKQIDEVKAILEKARDLLDGVAADSIDPIQEDEQEGFYNLSEGLQASDNGQRMEAAAERLGEASEAVTEAFDALENAISKLEEAQE